MEDRYIRKGEKWYEETCRVGIKKESLNEIILVRRQKKKEINM
jgi:hypothetical protein